MGKMKWRKTIIFLMIAIFLFSIAAVSASDVDDMEIASEDANQIELSASNEMDVDNLKTSEENTIETQAKNNKSMSAALGSKLLTTDTGTYSGLYSEIGSGGNIELQHDYYTYDWGRTIQITLDNTVIDGKGAIIDMDGSTDMQPFYVTASGVTFKNLTIQNANCHGYGGAIYCKEGDLNLINVTFLNNEGVEGAGAIMNMSEITVSDCTFEANTSQYGSAIFSIGDLTVMSTDIKENSSGYGTILNQGNIEIRDSRLTSNTASISGGSIYNKGNAAISTSDTMLLILTNVVSFVAKILPSNVIAGYWWNI